MEERRDLQRQRALKSARIVFNKRSSVMDCTVRNLSATGAMLGVSGPQGIPEVFELMLDAGATTRNCRVVWRKEDRIGVQFV